MLIDSHCHLDFPDFTDDFDAVLARAHAAGLARMITVSTSLANFSKYAALAEAYPAIYCTVGTHPNHVHEEVPQFDDIIRLSQHAKCVAIGEAGLDYHYDRAPRLLAEKVFRTHIAAARQTGLPLIIHTRECDADIERILRDEMGQGRFRALLHCFTSSRELAQAGIELGLYVSFSGVLTFKSAQHLRDLAAELPIDRLLVETDAPFLAPVPYRGKRNEPAFVAQTAAVLGRALHMTAAEIALVTTQNCARLFDKMPVPEAMDWD